MRTLIPLALPLTMKLSLQRPHRRSAILASLAGLACGLSLSIARPARADASAETLYQEGRRAAAQRDWDVACKKFRESHDREPAPGTLLNLGDCEEKRGKLVAAQGHFASAARLFRPSDERASYAKQRAVALERRVPKLAIRLAPSSPVGTSVERDGVPVDAGALNVTVAVDPGERLIVVRAPGRSDARTIVRLAESEVREVEVAAGAADGMQVRVDATKPANAGAAVSLAPPPQPRSGSPVPTKTLAFVSFGVGAAALGVGIVGGLKTVDADSVTRTHCDPAQCDPIGFKAQEDGRTWSTVSTVGFVAAGVFAATGAALLLLSPSKPSRPQTGLAVGASPFGSTVRYSAEF